MNGEENPPLIAAAIASFDILSGIKVMNQWLPNHGTLPIPLLDILKLTLSNIHRQKEEALLQFVTSTSDMQQVGLFVVSSYFMIQKKKDKIFYNVSLIFDRNSIDPKRFSPYLEEECREIAYTAKSTISSNSPLSKLDVLIQRTNEVCQILSRSGVSKLPDIVVHPSDAAFFGLILTAHLTTHMNTVIESNNPEEAEKYGNFLAHFTLPNILQHACLDYLPAPVPGLSIQLVSKQPDTTEDFLLRFRSPTTLIRMPERLVISTPSADTQERAHGDFMIANAIESGQRQIKIAQLKMQYKNSLIQVKPAPWATATVAVMTQMPKNTHSLICRQQLNSIIGLSLAVIEFVDEKLSLSKSAFLQPDEINDIIKTLKLTGKNDLSLIISVAQMFDQSLQRKLFLSRKDVFMQFTNVY